MGRQINFYISPQKEKELIAFINDECDSKILLPFIDDGKKELGKEAMSLHMYFVIPNSCNVSPKYKKGEWVDGTQKMILNTVLKNSMYSLSELPFIEYSRGIFDKDKEDDLTFVRLYCDLMFCDHKNVLKETYVKLTRWVKKNSTKTDRDFGISIYIVK